jgi:mono/diheme cytochrome c family protein
LLRTDHLSRAALRLGLAAALLIPLAGCRQDMHDQAKIEPLEASVLFENGAGARLPPVHTVRRGQLAYSDLFLTGLEANGEWTANLPVTLDATLLARGEERFNVFCTPCHDRAGSGRGMIVQRGFLQPPTYHQDRLRDVPVGYLFDVMSNGYGQMSGYAAQVKPQDRWAIAAWIRVLQRSQNVAAASLDGDQRRLVEEGFSQPAPSGQEADH